MKRKSTKLEEASNEQVQDSLSKSFYRAVGNLKWTEYLIRKKILSDDELNELANFLEEYAKRGKESIR